jgi:hypothetical protein
MMFVENLKFQPMNSLIVTQNWWIILLHNVKFNFLNLAKHAFKKFQNSADSKFGLLKLASVVVLVISTVAVFKKKKCKTYLGSILPPGGKTGS